MRNLMLAWIISAASALAYAQAPQTQPGTTQAAPGSGVLASGATQPAGADQAFEARVIKVAGRVRVAMLDDNGQVGEWRQVKLGDRLPAGAQLKTGLRSKVILAFGDDTVVMIENATMASINEFHRAGDAKRIRLGLGHGAIRAGVAEPTLRSDMKIETPTSTLSKKGTMDFRIEYEPVTGRWRISLEGEGLVEALNSLSNERRDVAPQQYVTQAMISWIESRAFDQWVPVVDAFGLTDSEQAFNVANHSGFSFLDPNAGAYTNRINGRDGYFAGVAGVNSGAEAFPLIPVEGRRVLNRPEGNFGTGGGSLIALLNSQNAQRRR